MKKQILFIHGGGENGFEADTELYLSLQKALGEGYKVHYPKMPSDETLPDFGWLQCIEDNLFKLDRELIVVGHSLGASMLLKYLSEHKIQKTVIGILLIATPFWNGDEKWVKGLMLQKGFEDKLPNNIPIYLYHCRDDKEVSFKNLAIYSEKLPQARLREIARGGHQLDNDLTIVANDIKALFKINK